MATTQAEIMQFLTELKIKAQPRDENRVGFMWGMETYRNPAGEDGLTVVIRLSENGEYIEVFSPRAFMLTGPHVDVALRACMMYQWNTKLVQFEYDATDGEIQAIIEFPIEDAQLTKKQLERCVYGLARLVEAFHPTIKKALADGVIDMPQGSPAAGPSSVMLDLLISSLRAEGKTDADPQLAALLQMRTNAAATAGAPAAV